MVMKIIFSRREINLGRRITMFCKKCISVFWLNRRLPDSYVCFCRFNLLQFHISCCLWKTALYMHKRKSEKAKYWLSVTELILVFYASRKGLGDRKVCVCFPKTLILPSLLHERYTSNLWWLCTYPLIHGLQTFGKRQGGWVVSEMPNFPLLILSSPKKAMETSQAVSGSASRLYHTATSPSLSHLGN